MELDAKQRQPLKVCAAVLIDQGKVLITKRPEEKQQGGLWEFPGGKLNKGENPQQALSREIKEELDINIDIQNFLLTVNHQYDWGSVHIMTYLCRWTGGEIRHLDVADHAWVSPGELYDYDILAADLPILDAINRRFA